MTIRLIASAVIAALLLAGGIPAVPQDQAPIAATPALTQELAEEIALDHAGLTRAEVTALSSHRDQDRGIPHWDVEFRHGDWEFDYEVATETGAILDWDKEYDPLPAAKPPAAQPPAAQPPAAGISAQEAQAIALAHAGLSAGDVRGLRSEKDRDHGILTWEVEFTSGNWEFDYEIHAETGAILEWDKDFDD